MKERWNAWPKFAEEKNKPRHEVLTCSALRNLENSISSSLSSVKSLVAGMVVTAPSAVPTGAELAARITSPVSCSDLVLAKTALCWTSHLRFVRILEQCSDRQERHLGLSVDLDSGHGNEWPPTSRRWPASSGSSPFVPGPCCQLSRRSDDVCRATLWRFLPYGLRQS